MMSRRYDELFWHDDNIPIFCTPHKEKKMNQVRFVTMFSYKDDSLNVTNPQWFYCFENNRLPIYNLNEATKKAKELAGKIKDKKIYVAQLISVSEFVPPIPDPPPIQTTYFSNY